MSRKIRVGVVFGGRSVEHEVSLVSARSVMDAIDRERFEVVPIGVTREGLWLASGDPLQALGEAARTSERTPAASRPVIPGISAPPEPVAEAPREKPAAGMAGSPSRGHGPSMGDARVVPAREAGRRADGPGLDVVFPLVHGVHGEDGTLQGLLEMADVPYVGAGVLGSAIGMDKEVARRLMRAEGLPVVPCRVVRDAEWRERGDAALEDVAGTIGLPCFVKPSGSGSSVGVTRVADRQGIAAAVAHAFEFDTKVLIEKGVDAREIEVAVLGNDDPAASVPGEIIPCGEFYDYEAKYHAESKLLVPAPLDEGQVDAVRSLALRAFRTLELAGMARVDFFLDRSDGRFWVNEVNTLPGFTPVSMYPRLWEATGVPYRDLITRLIDLALERHARRSSLRTTLSLPVRS